MGPQGPIWAHRALYGPIRALWAHMGPNPGRAPTRTGPQPGLGPNPGPAKGTEKEQKQWLEEATNSTTQHNKENIGRLGSESLFDFPTLCAPHYCVVTVSCLKHVGSLKIHRPGPGWGSVRVGARSGLGPIWAHKGPILIKKLNILIKKYKIINKNI